MQKMPRKNVFLVLSSKTRKLENGFLQNCQTLFVPGGEKNGICVHMSGREKNGIFVHTIFWAKIVWGQNSQSQEELSKCGFNGNCLKTTMTPSFQKVFRDG